MPEAPPQPRSGAVLVAFITGQIGMHSAMAGLRMAAPLQALHEGFSAWTVGLLLALFALAPVVSARMVAPMNELLVNALVPTNRLGSVSIWARLLLPPPSP